MKLIKSLLVLGFMVLSYTVSCQEEAIQPTVLLEIPLTVACDSPFVYVFVKCPQGIENLGRFRLTMRYFNPSFYFNGMLWPNPALPGLTYQYYPGGATDILIVERNDTTAVTLGDDYLFIFVANYYGGEANILFDTLPESPDRCFMEESGGDSISLNCLEGKVVPPGSKCIIESVAGNANQDILVPVTITNLDSLASFQFAIEYQPGAMEYLGIQGINPALMPSSNLSVSGGGGLISCAWSYPGFPVSPGAAPLFYLKFHIQNIIPDLVPVMFAALPEPYVKILDPEGLFQTSTTCFYGGWVEASMDVPDSPLVCAGLSPNPSPDGLFNVDLSPSFCLKEICVYDVTGRLLLKNVVHSNAADRTTLDLSTAPPGVYFVVLKSESDLVRLKAVVGR